MTYKRFLISVFSVVFTILLLVSLIVYYVDPYFQYHIPNKNMNYVLDTNSFAYINPGIAKNFDYDTIITGSSMSRAFMPSYVDTTFSCKTVKLSMAEARGKDYAELFKILKEEKKLKRVIMGLDTFAYEVDQNYSTYSYPSYLYDNSMMNDILYLTNMRGLTESYYVMKNTKYGVPSTTMDAYQNYALENEFSEQKVLEIYRNYFKERGEEKYDVACHSKMVLENLEQNIIPMIEERDEVEFMFYFPPYSIVRWGLAENIDKDILTMKLVTEKLISYDNVSIYFYQGETDIIQDLEHYMDTIHFDVEISKDIIDYIANQENRLTKNNYLQKIDEFEEFVKNYNYDNFLK